MNTIVRRALIITYLVLVVFAFGLGMLAGLYHYYSDSLPPLSELEHFDLKEGSKVFDRHDRLIHTFAVEHRTMMSLREISPWVADAALSVEDARFYKHWGRDLTRVVRAVMEDAVTLNFSQGASTITQQLAATSFSPSTSNWPAR
jgi:penicillin-binding protein 1A